MELISDAGEENIILVEQIDRPAGFVWQGWGAYAVYDPAKAVSMRPYRKPATEFKKSDGWQPCFVLVQIFW